MASATAPTPDSHRNVANTPNMSSSGIDYSKWDKLEVGSSSEDEDNRQTKPRVTRLDSPSQVTLNQSGEVAIHQGGDATTTTAAAPQLSRPNSKTKGTAESLSTSEQKNDSYPLTWTEKGGSTPLPPLRGQPETSTPASTLLWSQDRTSVTLRIGPLTSVKGWNVTVHGMLKYRDRHVGMTASSTGTATTTTSGGGSTTKPTLEICQTGQAGAVSPPPLLPPTALPHPIHATQSDSGDELEVDWTIERVPAQYTSHANEPYLCIQLYKAVPMEGVVVWWSRPLDGIPDISMEWRRDMAGTASFQNAWDEAHVQFRKQLDDRKATTSQPVSTTVNQDRMWKPGEERPHSGREPKGKKKTPDKSRNRNNNLATSESNPAIKKLSSGTMNMRFMQRRTTSVSPKQVQQESETKSHSQSSIATSHDVEMVDVDDIHATPAPEQGHGFVSATTTQDMYGTILLGRRSFGDKNRHVDQNYKQSLSAVSKKQGKRKRKRT